MSDNDLNVLLETLKEATIAEVEALIRLRLNLEVERCQFVDKNNMAFGERDKVIIPNNIESQERGRLRAKVDSLEFMIDKVRKRLEELYEEKQRKDRIGRGGLKLI